MKRVGGLWPKLVSWPHLMDSAQKAAAGKRLAAPTNRENNRHETRVRERPLAPSRPDTRLNLNMDQTPLSGCCAALQK
jgi:hypothetical protein